MGAVLLIGHRFGFEVVLKKLMPSFWMGMHRIRDLFDESVRKRPDAIPMLRPGAVQLCQTDWPFLGRYSGESKQRLSGLDINTPFFGTGTALPWIAVLASNTSSFHSFHRQCEDQAASCGLHFFNPVYRMQLVEIVRTEHSRIWTDDAD